MSSLGATCSRQHVSAAPRLACSMAASRLAAAKRVAFTPAVGSGPCRSSTALKAAASMMGEAAEAAPNGFISYETMIVLRPNMSEEERDQELAKFEAFLKKQAATDIRVTVRGRQRLAYPIKKFSEGIYVLYAYSSAPPVSQAVQKYLSTPEAGAELNILRHMTMK